MKYSYSNINTFIQCPYRWKLQYIDKLKVIPPTNADNALYLGLALHKGVEEWSVDAAVEEYKSHYPILTDAHVSWIMQLEYQVPRLLELLPKGGVHEIRIDTKTFVGFADYVVGDTFYDFKFSNNIDGYLHSPQLSIYKHYLEKTHPDMKINHLKFVFVPKVMIRQRKRSNETIMEFRNRIKEMLPDTEIKIIEVPFDNNAVTDFKKCCTLLNKLNREKAYDKLVKTPSRLCDWCQYKDYCQSNGEINYMIL